MNPTTGIARCCALTASGTCRRHAAESSNEFAPSKAYAHLPLPCQESYEAE
jgi:hypothetical protein